MSNKLTVRGAVTLRDQKIHMSALMLLKIVEEVTSRHGTCFIGECHAYYQEARNVDLAVINYTYNGVSGMLRTLAKRGYLTSGRAGRYASYALTSKGTLLLAGAGA